MKKKLLIFSLLLITGTLAACSLPFSTSTQTVTSTGRNPALQDPSTLPIESKLAVGILKLEGTAHAIESAEAKELLPLFMAIKTLSTNTNTAPAEISALNKQIENTLKPEQITAIEEISLTSADLRTLMSEYGLGNNNSTRNSGITNSAARMGGGDFGPGVPGGIPGLGNAGQTASTSNVQATPNAAQVAQTARQTAGSLNLTFAEPVIKLLESKIN